MIIPISVSHWFSLQGTSVRLSYVVILSAGTRCGVLPHTKGSAVVVIGCVWCMDCNVLQKTKLKGLNLGMGENLISLHRVSVLL